MLELKRIEVEEKVANRFIRRKEEMGESNRSRVEFLRITEEIADCEFEPRLLLGFPGQPPSSLNRPTKNHHNF
jgi:hypothetical protein